MFFGLICCWQLARHQKTRSRRLAGLAFVSMNTITKLNNQGDAARLINPLPAGIGQAGRQAGLLLRVLFDGVNSLEAGVAAISVLNS